MLNFKILRIILVAIILIAFFGYFFIPAYIATGKIVWIIAEVIIAVVIIMGLAIHYKMKKADWNEYVELSKRKPLTTEDLLDKIKKGSK